jgi:hypothetical protein
MFSVEKHGNTSGRDGSELERKREDEQKVNNDVTFKKRYLNLNTSLVHIVANHFGHLSHVTIHSRHGVFVLLRQTTTEATCQGHRIFGETG